MNGQANGGGKWEDLLVRVEIETTVLAGGVVDEVHALVELTQLMVRSWR